jgi:hypothetical protein
MDPGGTNVKAALSRLPDTPYYSVAPIKKASSEINGPAMAIDKVQNSSFDTLRTNGFRGL